ncbi:DNA double-strand break repair nuclease NurA [Methanobacterium sp. ACI-7]|uniref:DNA double-strand break repair nuclease NurA n=1 Tax=unclassified Methanobacterium TaxID=2627676 RepID=UPI0039C4D076
MLDSLYEKALEKKDELNYRLEQDFKNINIDPYEFWVNEDINEEELDITISGGDGSRYSKEFMSFALYAVGAECLVYNSNGLESVECCDIDILRPYSYVKNRLDNYMRILEVKTNLKSLQLYDIDLILFDGSILGDIIRPSPLENMLPDISREMIQSKYLEKLEDSLKSQNVQIMSPKLFNLIETDFKKRKLEAMIYLESLENLVSLKSFLEKTNNIAAISKTSARSDYFGSYIPDMAIFDSFNKKQGYTKPKHFKISEIGNRKFPIYDEFFKELTFTIFYARLDNFKNVIKVELPYKADEEEIRRVLGKIKCVCADGYPHLLKKAHHDVIVKRTDLEMITRIMGFLEKTGREML